MTIVLHLSKEEEELIVHRATVARMTPEQYIVQSATGRTFVAGESPSVTPTIPTNWGARVLAELEADGVLGDYGNPEIDSPELARQLREQFSTRTAA